MPAKVKKLERKLDMNPHYLQLMEYLELLFHYPEHILDPAHHVFASEPRLYSGNQKVNHRLHKNYVDSAMFRWAGSLPWKLGVCG